MPSGAWAILWDKPVAYVEGLRLQLAVHAARLANRIPDTALVLQHAPVVTAGRRGRMDGLLLSEDTLAARGIELHVASRGGNLTFHGPGQWVLYPIFRISGGDAAHGHLWNLEETALRTAADFGVQAFRRPGMAGAWTDHGKIAAIGFHVRRGVTLHGLSFNVSVDLEGFSTIVPCGLAGEKVASLHSILGPGCPPMDQVRARLLHHCAEITGRDMTAVAADGTLPDPLAAVLREAAAAAPTTPGTPRR